MTPSDFIRAAIEGGWKMTPRIQGAMSMISPNKEMALQNTISCLAMFYIELILLDPEAWEAVGKEKKWKIDMCINCGETAEKCKWKEDCFQEGSESMYKMKEMIPFIQENQKIEDYLMQI